MGSVLGCIDLHPFRERVEGDQPSVRDFGLLSQLDLIKDALAASTQVNVLLNARLETRKSEARDRLEFLGITISFGETRPDKIAELAIAPDGGAEARSTREPGGGGRLVVDSKHAEISRGEMFRSGLRHWKVWSGSPAVPVPSHRRKRWQIAANSSTLIVVGGSVPPVSSQGGMEY